MRRVQFEPFDDYVGLGMEDGPVDRLMLQDPFELRARGEDTAPEDLTVFPVAPRRGPWSGDNQFGRTTRFDPDPDNRQTILKMDEWDMPQMWTVMLGIEDNSVETDPGNLLVQAELNVGSGGATQKLLVDWRQGTLLSIPMNSINVVAQYQVSTNTEGLDIDLTVILSRGTHSGLTAPTFTTFVLATGELREIPKFASHVTIMQFTTTAGDPFRNNSFYDFLGIGGTAQPIATIEGDDIPRGLGTPIPNGSKYMRASGSAATEAVTVFTLGGL